MKRFHPVFNVVKLTLAPADPILGRRAAPPPPPEIIDGEEEWVVEEILDSKFMNRKLRYLVKWKDFGLEHNSWEPWDNVHALGTGAGNPGVFYGYPYPYPSKTRTRVTGTGFCG